MDRGPIPLIPLRMHSPLTCCADPLPLVFGFADEGGPTYTRERRTPAH